MMMIVVFKLVSLVVTVTAFQLPFIDNVTFIAKSNSNSFTITNQTCQQCLCQSNSSYIALNCFSNETCQFFTIYPRTYRIQSNTQTRLYFLQQILPNPSQCCMPNTTYVSNKLLSSSYISANVSQPRCIVLDNHGYIVTISQANSTIVRLDPTNLTVIDHPMSPVFDVSPITIAYNNETYYVGFRYFILAVDSNDFSILQNITAPSLTGTRGMMFLDQGQTMVVASTENNAILFFNRSDDQTNNYAYIYQQTVNYLYPHGFWYINDTYFYLTSWQSNTIYSYSMTNDSLLWTEKFFLNGSIQTSGSDGNHLTIDECGRIWFSLGSNGIQIFNNQGSLLNVYSSPSLSIFDAIITDDYVIYLSDTQSNRIIRIDFNIQC